jgi:hypothetical protein
MIAPFLFLMTAGAGPTLRINSIIGTIRKPCDCMDELSVRTDLEKTTARLTEICHVCDLLTLPATSPLFPGADPAAKPRRRSPSSDE